MNKPGRKPQRRNFYPADFRDFILMELVDTKKELDFKDIPEKHLMLTNQERIKIKAITESRFLKFKILFLSKLLTH